MEQPIRSHRRNAIGGFYRNEGDDRYGDKDEAGTHGSSHRYRGDVLRRMNVSNPAQH
jgi:hypothetical protein